MENFLAGYLFIGVPLSVLVALAGVKRRIGFWKGFLSCMLLSPFIGLFIILSSGKLNAKGCKHCGNTYNEAEFCGICFKNEAGQTREEAAALK